jgi:hypothetical protein
VADAIMLPHGCFLAGRRRYNDHGSQDCLFPAVRPPLIAWVLVAQKHPKQATVERTITQRGIRVYLDYSQNLAEENTGGGV